MKLGIVGLPNVGKSTLFNAITNAGAQSANYPFCTIEPNIGTVAVPDYRLDELAKMYNPDKITPAVIEFVDIAGLVKGASKGERDIEVINLELIFSDLDILERRIDKAVKAAKGDKKYLAEVDLLNRVKAHLEEGKSARSMEFTDEEKAIMADIPLLSNKPIIYVANMSEDDFNGKLDANPFYNEVLQIAQEENSEVVPICARLEEEIADMSKEDKMMFLEELGLKESGLDRLIKAGYHLLGLISYLTAGKPEVRAWTITRGTKAPQAAGKIHSDFERGFIRAEVISYEDLIANGSIAAAKEKGLVRSEGKDYVMQDGDVVLFRFNV